MPILRRAWPALGLAGFTAAFLHPQLRRMDAVPDLGDPLFSIWRIGWVYRQLQGDPRALFDANIFHPERLTFAYSDSMLLPALAGAPLLAAGLHPVTVYNLLLVTSFALSSAAMFLLVRELTGSRPAAFVAALIFGFYPFRFEHYSHLELQVAFWMPLALLALHRFAAGAGRRWAFAAAAFAVAQLYSSMYLALYFVPVALIIAMAAFIGARERWRAWIPAGSAAALLAALLAVPLAQMYSANEEVAKGRPASEVAHYSAERLDYLRAHRRSVLWGSRTVPGRMEERALFPGLTPIVTAAVGLFTPGATALKAGYAGALLFAYEASHGPNGLVFPALQQLPPFASVRVPARFSLLVGLSIAVLAGFGVRSLLRGSAVRRCLTIALLGGAIFVDFNSRLPLQPVWRDPPALYDALPSGAVLAELPALGEARQFSSIPFMYFSTWHGHQLLNGYSGYLPGGYVELAAAIDRVFEPESLEYVRARGATHVTVNCALYRDAGFAERCRNILTRLDGSSGFEKVATVQWSGAPAVLYRIR